MDYSVVFFTFGFEDGLFFLFWICIFFKNAAPLYQKKGEFLVKVF